jgi:hypothetical protein
VLASNLNPNSAVQIGSFPAYNRTGRG